MTHETSPHLRRADALARKRAGETAQARVLISEFARQAVAQGITPQRLSARTYDGRSRYRTQTEGWYLKHDRTVAVGTDGEFYVLTVPRSLAGMLGRIELPPGEPPLELGKGGRDGQSIPLPLAIERRLAAGNDWD